MGAPGGGARERGEVAAALFVVLGTGRTTRRPARAAPCRRARESAAARATAASIVPHRSIGSGAGERRARSSPRPRRSSARPSRAGTRADASEAKSPCLSRPPRIRITLPSAKPSSDLAVASTLVPLESSTHRTPRGLGDELGAVRQALEARQRVYDRRRRRVRGIRPRRRGHRVLEVVRAGQREALDARATARGAPPTFDMSTPPRATTPARGPAAPGEGDAARARRDARRRGIVGVDDGEVRRAPAATKTRALAAA